VNVDDTRQYEERRRVYDVARRRRESGEIRLDGLDAAAPDYDVGAPRSRRCYDGSTADQEIRQSAALGDNDVLRAFPQASSAHLTQAIVPAVIGDDRRKVVPGELAHLR
jgi:hypothetical protein